MYTNTCLIQKGHPPTTIGEILKFFGVLILGTFFEFGDRKTLWAKMATHSYIPAPNFGRTRMGRDRFLSLFACIRFSHQDTKKPNGMLHERWRWMLVDASSPQS